MNTYRGILLSSLSLAYLACYSLPRAFSLLPGSVTGALTGLTLTLFNLSRYKSLRQKSILAESTLRDPFLPRSIGPDFKLQSAYSRSIVQFIVTFSIFSSSVPSALVLAILLGVEASFNFNPGVVLLALLAGLASRCFSAIPEWEGTVLSLSSGVLFHALVSNYLPSWDEGLLSERIFALGAFSVILLFISFSTLILSF